MMRTIGVTLAGLCYLLTGAAQAAAVYRCEVGGKMVYTDKPCASGSAPHAMAPLSTMPAAEGGDLAQDYDARKQSSRETKDKEDAAWLKAHAAEKAESARMDGAVREGKVLKDMTADQVRRTLGSPDEVERKDGRERWTYTGKKKQVVVLEGGKVVKSPASNQ